MLCIAFVFRSGRFLPFIEGGRGYRPGGAMVEIHCLCRTQKEWRWAMNGWFGLICLAWSQLGSRFRLGSYICLIHSKRMYASHFLVCVVKQAPIASVLPIIIIGVLWFLQLVGLVTHHNIFVINFLYILFVAWLAFVCAAAMRRNWVCLFHPP